jgi:flagellar biosynthesis protein FlhG
MFKLDSEKLSYFLNQLGGLALDYDYILFDMGAGITEESLHLLLSVHEIFVITTPEPTAMTDAYSMMKFICSKENNADFYLVVNRAHSSEEGMSTLSRLSGAMQQFLKKDIVQLGFLPDDRNVSKAVSRQTPFSIYDPKSKISIAIANLTERYFNHHIGSTGKPKPKSFGFISRLRHYFSER